MVAAGPRRRRTLVGRPGPQGSSLSSSSAAQRGSGGRSPSSSSPSPSTLVGNVSGAGPAQSSRQSGASGRWSSSASRTKGRSEEHTSELKSLMRISYAVFCYKTQNIRTDDEYKNTTISERSQK